ncbi:hypothetical protein [Taklimakanibacter albus]|uniref:Uncharacterized protein n=1 Tax=Taklimakanibacter albus TaxID=2800327 RepID=A0ACC5RBP2_9HYPH|nr:hypothetical protein [Aestuariivirga sp. YIM B02566]MBK1870074.1 hypothetical protein [Aestuariivirga sp. YIM B02566]
MPRNGSGIYGPPAGTAAVPNTTIESADYNAVVADLSQALTDSVNVLGTAPFLANQPMGGNKLTGLGAGAAAADSPNLGQVQSEIVAHAIAVSGTADAITATFSPAFVAYTAKMRFRFTAGAPNTTTAPTINIDGLGAKIIKKLNGAAVAIGDIAGSGHVCDCVYNGTDIILLNFAPVAVDREQTFIAKQTYSKPLITTMTTLADAATIAWDMNAASNDVRIVLTASRNLGLPTNMNTGQKGLLVVQQDGTGGWGLNLNAIFRALSHFDIEKAPHAKTAFAYQVVEDHTATKVILLECMWSEGRSSIGFYREFNLGSYAPSTSLQTQHNLGRQPSLVHLALHCTTADCGYSSGNRVWNVASESAAGVGAWADSNTAGVCINRIVITHKASFESFFVTVGRWNVILRVYE